jgi:hypothetical protein
MRSCNSNVKYQSQRKNEIITTTLIASISTTLSEVQMKNRLPDPFPIIVSNYASQLMPSQTDMKELSGNSGLQAILHD